MSHVAKKQRTALIRNSAETSIIPIPGVSTTSADEQFRAEIQSLLLELIIIDVPGLAVHLVRQTLEINRRGGYLLPAGSIISVSQVTAGRQIEPHDAIVGVEESRVSGEIRRTAGVGLHIDAPGGGIEVKSGQGTIAAEILDLVNEFVAAVVAISRHTFGVFVGEGGAQGLDHSKGGEILRGDQFDPPALPPLLLLDQVVDFRIDGDQRLVPPDGDGIHSWRRDLVREMTVPTRRIRLCYL